MTRARWIGAAGLVVVTIWAFWPGGASDAAPGVQVGPTEAYNPVAAGEVLPDGFRQLLPRDAILPIYDPAFVPAAQADWPQDVQVIGVAAGDEAKAYPVSALNRREMVIDEIGGDPILVTW